MNRNRKTKEILTCALVAAGVLLVTTRDANTDFKFDTPTNLGPAVNSSSFDNDPIISPDGLELYFTSNRPGGSGSYDIWVTTRETMQHPWGEPLNLGPPINSTTGDAIGGISPDGLALYFTSDRSGGSGGYDIWVATRETIQDSWGDQDNLGSTINSWANDFGGRISADGLSFFFCSNRPGGSGGVDLWVSTRPTLSDPWGAPANLGSKVNSSVWDYSAAPSPDCLLLFFSSNRPGGYGAWSIWVTQRATRDDDWGTPVNLEAPVNSMADQENPYISADGSTLYFGSTRGSSDSDLWQVSIDPVVDLNTDAVVNFKDLSKLTQSWQQNDRSVDIGPTPLGDGIVDFQDMVVLAEYWLEDFRVIAHWKFDETEGGIARDSAGDKDGILHGDPVWQPTGGKVAGALQFDGANDYVSTDFVLNPLEGSFSVFAWTKGGGPGEVIISQTGGTTMFGSAWLCTDPSHGNLMTELMEPNPSLQSDSAIADGEWHHIGLVYDLDVLRRHLYVDGAEVAKDTMPVGWVPSDGGLHFGAAKDLDAASFFSGLIDDVKIYDRAIVP